MLFWVVLVAILGFGGWQLYQEVSGANEPKQGDHWHAALGVNVCGEWVSNPPEFEARFGTEQRAGLHSHGDGLIHIHPFADDEAGGQATVGRFFEYGGWILAEDRFKLWEGDGHQNGQTCPDGRVANVRFEVNGEPRTGDPADVKPEDNDVVAIAFLPDGDVIGEPPSTANLANPVDEQSGG